MKLKPPHFEANHLALELAHAPSLAVLLDLDGTLIPFADTAEATPFDPPLVELLATLDRADVEVAIVSGRPRDLIAPFCELAPHVRWVAEHGAWSREASGSWTGAETAAEVGELVHVLAPFLAEVGTRIERKSQGVCLHWRAVPAARKVQVIAAAELACDEWLESHPEFERLDGVEMLEIRRSSLTKGVAVEWVRRQLPDARMIAIGDDVTDDDMFAALRSDDLAIGVGARPGLHHCTLSGPTAVREFLAWLARARTTGDTTVLPSLACRMPVRVPARTRLLVVSNRIPPGPGKPRAIGGLVSALEPALHAHEGVWLGWSGAEATGERRLTLDDSTRPIRASFDFPPTWKEHFYGGFCNRALWPLFHGLAGLVRYVDADWAAYVEANEEFAARALELVAPDGTIWIHDYHLLLAGSALRRRGFTGPLGMFLHIPFAGPELFDTLPWGSALIEGMLAFDLIGFHTERWADQFRACARDHARIPEIAVLPIGIDPETFSVPPGAVDREVANLQAMLGPRRLILGVDRLDYAKGIPERLVGFERLLETKPEWRGRIAFVQISVPSRADVPEYAELRQRVENLVGRINGRFGEADWVPVRYLYRSYDHGVLAQLYRAADVALVTPLRDGLNLVAKEFVAAQDPDAPGILVLSRFAGAAAELTDAVITNPYHPEGLANDLDRALRMDLAERRRRHTSLLAAITGKTPERWATSFLDHLATAHQARAISSPAAPRCAGDTR